MKWLVLSSLALLLGHAAGAHASASPTDGERPLKVSLCAVVRNPGAYNHKLIEISGKVSRGFEDFTLSDACHISSVEIWLDFGGKRGAQVEYCCGNTAAPQREKPLVVEGIATTLTQDAKFQRFQDLTRGKSGYGDADATFVGWFFSGKKQVRPSGTRWMGYGHMGFFSLLVIQRVVAVTKP